MKAKKKNKDVNAQPQASSVRLQHDPIPNTALTPLKEFNYAPDEATYDALRFLASWYNSDQYAGMEHDRGRDSSIPGRHILQTAYGKSRTGNRDTPYERAARIAYSPRLKLNQSLDYGTAGQWDPREGTVEMASQNLFDQKGLDRAATLVHELYHGAEGGRGWPAVDQRFNWALDQRAMGLKDPYEAIDGMNSEERKSMIQLRENLQASNPYTEEDWQAFMNNLDDASQIIRANIGNVSYVNEPSEATARLREAAFTAQKLGYLDQGDFNLTDEILEKIRYKSLAADQLLKYSTPEQRQFYYDNL